MAKAIPVLLGLLGLAGAVIALVKFARFSSLLGSFMEFVSLRPGRKIPGKPFAVVFIVIGLMWGALMVILGLHQ